MHLYFIWRKWITCTLSKPFWLGFTHKFQALKKPPTFSHLNKRLTRHECIINLNSYWSLYFVLYTLLFLSDTVNKACRVRLKKRIR